jgi:hypothetical protein
LKEFLEAFHQAGAFSGPPKSHTSIASTMVRRLKEIKKTFPALHF